MTDSLDLKSLCDSCVEIAREAGRKILDIYNTEFDIEHKDDKSPLTNADMASHHTIVRALTALTPDIPILSEESAKLPFEQRKQWAVYWLVDPLDGTREFIKRNGEFTVNIALIDNHKSVLGVIHVPVLGIDYFAWEGGGAFKAEHRATAVPISVKAVEDNKLVVAGSRSHGSEEMQKYMEKLADRYSDIDMMSMGSSLKFCLVAEGKADLYPRLGLTSEWDTAAA
ncbi:MAG: 3'(2'),5'-bisphosphate nucleotidase CysQ, partial [Gammaproteobacteria bacterium]